MKKLKSTILALLAVAGALLAGSTQAQSADSASNFGTLLGSPIVSAVRIDPAVATGPTTWTKKLVGQSATISMNSIERVYSGCFSCPDSLVTVGIDFAGNLYQKFISGNPIVYSFSELTGNSPIAINIFFDVFTSDSDSFTWPFLTGNGAPLMIFAVPIGDGNGNIISFRLQLNYFLNP